jgi:hypothetical protein
MIAIIYLAVMKIREMLRERSNGRSKVPHCRGCRCGVASESEQ